MGNGGKGSTNSANMPDKYDAKAKAMDTHTVTFLN